MKVLTLLLITKKEEKKKGAFKGKKDAAVPMKCYGNKVACFFYKKKRHIKKDCIKNKKWLEKKVLYISSVS